MASLFPGMDPYLEGYIWADVHQRLAGEISQQLAPLISPRYVARLAISMITDAGSGSPLNIMYPDVEILDRNPRFPPPTTGGLLVTTPPALITKPLSIPLTAKTVKIVTVEIRDVAHNHLVTSIEILSPVNKREPGVTEYRNKQERLLKGGVHLLEIDFLRRGQRPFTFWNAPDTPYRVTLIRAGNAFVDLWPIELADTLPIVAVPLRAPDPDVPLDLGKALTNIYEKAFYELSIDYRESPPPPALKAKEEVWLNELLKEIREKIKTINEGEDDEQ